MHRARRWIWRVDICHLLSIQCFTPFLPARGLPFVRSICGNVLSTDACLSPLSEATRSFFVLRPDIVDKQAVWAQPQTSFRVFRKSEDYIHHSPGEGTWTWWLPMYGLQQGSQFLPYVQAHPQPQLFFELLSSFPQVTFFWSFLQPRDLASVSCTQDASWSRTVRWAKVGSCTPSHHQSGLASHQTKQVLRVQKYVLWDWYFKNNSTPSSCGLESGWMWELCWSFLNLFRSFAWFSFGFHFDLPMGSELRDLNNRSLALLAEHTSLHLSHLLNQGTASFRVKTGCFLSWIFSYYIFSTTTVLGGYYILCIPVSI